MTDERKAVPLTAGRKLDAEIAEKVMGWKLTDNSYPYWQDGPNVTHAHKDEWSPSTDIRAAWQVVEKMERKFTTVQVIWEGPMYGARCLIRDEDGGAYSTEADCRGKTAPEAICLAALKAVGVEAP